MTWSYTSPSTSDSDMVRFRIGDTDTTDQLLSNEEITAILAVQTTVNLAAAQCAEAIAAKFARQVNTTNISMSIGAEARMKHYMDLARTIRDQSSEDAIYNATIAVAASSVSEKETLSTDSSLVQPSFRVGMHDNPSTYNDEDDT